MSFISLTTKQLFYPQYTSWDVPPRFIIYKRLLKKAHTYIMIFSVGQNDMYKGLIAQPNINILYESIPAVNYIHPGPPRNTVVVFELKNETKAKSVPKVSG